MGTRPVFVEAVTRAIEFGKAICGNSAPVPQEIKHYIKLYLKVCQPVIYYIYIYLTFLYVTTNNFIYTNTFGKILRGATPPP